jgi:hypothetical protein
MDTAPLGPNVCSQQLLWRVPAGKDRQARGFQLPSRLEAPPFLLPGLT